MAFIDFEQRQSLTCVSKKVFVKEDGGEGDEEQEGLTSFSSVKIKSVIVDMVQFKSSDPNSEKPLLLFFLFTIVT